MVQSNQYFKTIVNYTSIKDHKKYFKTIILSIVSLEAGISIAKLTALSDHNHSPTLILDIILFSLLRQGENRCHQTEIPSIFYYQT